MHVSSRQYFYGLEEWSSERRNNEKVSIYLIGGSWSSCPRHLSRKLYDYKQQQFQTYASDSTKVVGFTLKVNEDASIRGLKMFCNICKKFNSAVVETLCSC